MALPGDADAGTVSPQTLSTLALIFMVAVLSPALSDALRRFRIPPVVIEIAAGVVIGPQVLGWAHLTSSVTALSNFGLSFLMFLAGFEIDFNRIRGRPLTLAGAGWGISLVLGLALGVVAQLGGNAISWLIIGLCLTTTALGTMLPMWRDAGTLDSNLGPHVMAVGSFGEFGPIVAVAVLLSSQSAVKTTVLLLAFVAVAVAAVALAMLPKGPRLSSHLERHLHSSSQLPVRLAMLIVAVLFWVTTDFGLDVLLGAFTAGLVVRLGANNSHVDELASKFDAIGLGVFIPIFFVVTGMNLDLKSFIHDPANLVRVPIFLVGCLVARGLPAMVLYRREFPAGSGERPALALFSATALPLVVVITGIGVQSGELLPSTAAALVVAAMLSVLLFPSVAFGLLERGSPPRSTSTGPEPAHPAEESGGGAQ